MQNISKEFPILDQYIYANTAAHGILFDRLLDWRQEHDLDYLIGGSMFKTKALQTIIDTRAAVGQFFNCKKEHVALIPNFSIGLNMLLEGLDKKHKVLLVNDDYPSLTWPFESRGFDCKYLDSTEHLERDILSAISKEKITVLAISLVQWLNGIKIDLEFLKKLKETQPELLIIADGTQFCGTESFDFDNSGIDVLGASAYKWLLAGSGNGFMLFKDTASSFFSLKTIGFNSVNADLTQKDNARFTKHFEPGHLDSLSFGSLKKSLEFLTDIGMDSISAANRELSAFALQEFSKLGVLEESVVKRKTHSTIFTIAGDQKLFDQLTHHHIICSQRGKGIRLSFHFYNTTKNIRKVIDVIKKSR
tara:strand:- start:1778 stop:2863 length:1086 start_codon:yes stop_codon:yes gene_type:complete